jgi:hypothetical protein
MHTVVYRHPQSTSKSLLESNKILSGIQTDQHMHSPTVRRNIIIHLMMHGAFLSSVLYSGCLAIDPLDHQERLAQVRFYNKPGCFQENEGELGIYDLGISTCHVPSEGYSESLRIEYIKIGCYRRFPSPLYAFQGLNDVMRSTYFRRFILSFTPRDCVFACLLFWPGKNRVWSSFALLFQVSQIR